MMRSIWQQLFRDRLHTEHEKMEDPRMKGHRIVYVSQALLATSVILAALVVKDVLANAAVFAAIASTAFVLFVTPRSIVATPRHVVGGHVICAAVGAVTAVILSGAGVEAVAGDSSVAFSAGAAIAVGVGILLMGLTDTEHPPATGTALGMAIVDFDGGLLLVLLVSVAILVLAQQAVLARLRDLL